MIKRWWLAWAGAGMFGLMLYLGLADTGWKTPEPCQGENPQDMLIGLGAPAALVAVCFGLLWARFWRHVRDQPIRAFGLSFSLLGGVIGLAVPVLVIVLVAESSVVSA